MKYALIIGNDKYNEKKLAQLKTPSEDAQALAKILEDKNTGAFDQVISLINKDEREVRRAIGNFLNNKKPEDLVLLYFSGHGILDQRGRLFLGVRDTEISSITSTAIASSFISDELDNCRSKRQILILDCCHSGAYARGTKGEQKAVTESTFEGYGFGRVVLTASDSTQYALEGEQIIAQTRFSLFTHFLLLGLSTGEADSNRDGFIDLDEWYDYAFSKVVSETSNQIPNKWSYKQQGDLIISRNPNFRKKSAELPSEIIKAMGSDYQPFREGAVNELGKLALSPDPEMASLAQKALEKMKEDDSRKVSSLADSYLRKVEKPAVTPIPKQPEAGQDKHKWEVSRNALKILPQDKALFVVMLFFGLLLLGYLLYQVAFRSYSNYPIQLYVDQGTITIYRDAELKSPIEHFPPDETIYYPCMFDISSNSYLIATSSENCQTQKTLGWVRARVVKKVFVQEFPYTQP